MKSIVVVLDAVRWLNRSILSANVQQLLHEQLKFGSHILVNKADLLTDEDRAENAVYNPTEHSLLSCLH